MSFRPPLARKVFSYGDAVRDDSVIGLVMVQYSV